MTTKGINSKSPTIRRILREAAELSSSPSADIHALPTESDLFSWHFTLRGPPSSAYSSGIYHGRIVLPPTYPLRPPSFRFLTPSGRFEVNREICLSISGHHEETWMPAWGVRTALVALRAFLETPAAGQVGGLEMGEAARRSLAEQSRRWRCAECGRSNEEILRESEEAARKLEAEGSRKMEEKVPEELKLGYREDIVKPGPAQVDSHSELQISHSASITLTQDEDSEVAELAEGFVPTVPLPSLPQYQSPQQFEPFSSSPSPQPAQRVPQATGSTSASTPAQYTSTTTTQRSIPQQRIQQQQQIQQLQRRRDRSNEGVPLWVDRTIMLLGAALIAMLLKAIFGR